MVSTRHVRRTDAWVVVACLGLLGAMGCRQTEVRGDDDEPTGGSDTAEPGEDSDEGGDSEDEPPEDTSDEPPPPEDAVPPPGGLRRLLSHQYAASVEYLLGAEAMAHLQVPLDPVLGPFDAMATLVSAPSTLDVQTYERAAIFMTREAVEHREHVAQWVPCVQEGPFDDACYEAVATDFGRLAWRRTLTGDQVERLVAVARAGRELGDFEFAMGLDYLLATILQSPYFLYLVELGEPGEHYRELTGLELATRMSLFILGRTPSLEVLDRAEAGELDTDEGIRALAWEMVEDPRARQTVQRLFGELLTVRDLPSKGKDAFPMFSDQLAASMMEETQRLIEDVVFTEGSSVLRLFDSDYTFINNDLAGLYGYGPVAPGQWRRVELPQGRAGVLSLAAWLTMTSHNTVNSPTRRGLFVMEQLLCGEVPPPPPEVNPEPIEPVEGQTLRESLSQQVEDDACSGCHSIIDPIGFGFEHLNPIGIWQSLDNGQPVDASGHLPGHGDFYGADELAQLLASSPELPRCLVDKVLTANLGVLPGEAMAPALDAVDAAYAAADHDLKFMLVELTTSPVFRLVDEPK